MRAAVFAAFAHAAVCAADNFAEWQVRYSKRYGSDKEYEKREECFRRNVQSVAALNARGGGARFALGAFADQCTDEFLAGRVGRPAETCQKFPAPQYDKSVDVSHTIDWRAKGAVTPVKNQGSCGGCWAFSAVGNLEGLWFRKKGELVEFSEQELISCDGGDGGCGGGGADSGLDWVVKNGGINTESAYPYASGGGTAPACDTAKAATKAAKIDSYAYIPQKNETKLLSALHHEGPISVVLQATDAWHHYSSGVMDASTCAPGGSINHAVLLVGYGFDSGNAYWVIKNSWGTDFGEKGYIRLAFGTNTCNVVNCISAYGVIGAAPAPGPPSGAKCGFHDCSGCNAFCGAAASCNTGMKGIDCECLASGKSCHYP